MKDIEKKLYAYYKEQTENAPVICCTDNKKIIKKQSRQNKRWLKVAVCAVLVVAIGVGFMGTDYQSFFTQPDLPPDNIINAPGEETENITNDDTPEINNSKEPEASEDIKEPSTDNSHETEPNQGVTSTPDNSIDIPSQPDVSEDVLPEESTDIPYEPKVVYAEGYGFSGGGLELTTPDDLLPWYRDKPTLSGGFWADIFKNPKDIYYVCLKPSCIEYAYYDKIYFTKNEETKEESGDEYLRKESAEYSYTPPTFKEWKENSKWMIEKDLESFGRFGIEAKVHYYGYDWAGLIANGGSKQHYYYHELQDELIGRFDYFFTAYASGEDLINYAKTVTEEYKKTYDALYKATAELFLEEKGYEMSNLINTDIAGLLLYGDLYELGFTDSNKISDMILTKWSEHADNGLRPQSPSGGTMSLLPEGDEREMIYAYYLSSFWRSF